MQPVIHDMEQGTDSWHKIRLNRITASHYADVQAKGGGKMRDAYLERLTLEHVYGVPCGHEFKGTWMERGTEMEPEAISAYEDDQLCIVQRVGFISLGDWMGCSPDGLLGDDGGLEVKSPMLKTHRGYINDGILPKTYHWQVHFSMALTGKKYWDFVSYHPDAIRKDGTDERLFIVKVERDEKICDGIKYECDRFINDLKASITKITGKEM